MDTLIFFKHLFVLQNASKRRKDNNLNWLEQHLTWIGFSCTLTERSLEEAFQETWRISRYVGCVCMYVQ